MNLIAHFITKQYTIKEGGKKERKQGLGITCQTDCLPPFPLNKLTLFPSPHFLVHTFLPDFWN